MIYKTRNWEKRLFASVRAARTQPFQWGVNDCALGTANHVLAFTNVDLAADYRGKYRTLAGARRICGSDARAFLAFVDRIFTEHGMWQVDVKFAQIGDVTFYEKTGFSCVAMCVGLISVAPGKDGLQHLPTKEALCAWRIPL